MLERLTAEQERLMYTVRDEWINKLGNLKLDKLKVQEGIEFMYELSGLNKLNIIYVKSPLALQYALHLIKNYEKVLKDFSIGKNYGNQVWNQVWNQVRDQVGNQVWNQVLSYQPMINRGSLYDWDWNSWIDYWQRISILDKDDMRISKLLGLSSAYDFLMYENLVIACEHPSNLKKDDQGRLHCDDGTAISWEDGYELYFINGVNVDEQIVMSPESITADQIQSQSNQEKRRIMIERYGTGKYLTDIDASVIDVDLRGVDGGGARALMRESNGNQWLVATDGSTERVYHLFVPSNVKTCREAHEAICGFSELLVKAEG